MTGEGWLAVGDAACTLDPLSSQGIGWAIVSGLEAARAILDTQSAEAGDRYTAGLRERYRDYLATRRAYYGRAAPLARVSFLAAEIGSGGGRPRCAHRLGRRPWVSVLWAGRPDHSDYLMDTSIQSESMRLLEIQAKSEPARPIVHILSVADKVGFTPPNTQSLSLQCSPDGTALAFGFKRTEPGRRPTTASPICQLMAAPASVLTQSTVKGYESKGVDLVTIGRPGIRPRFRVQLLPHELHSESGPFDRNRKGAHWTDTLPKASSH